MCIYGWVNRQCWAAHEGPLWCWVWVIFLDTTTYDQGPGKSLFHRKNGQKSISSAWRRSWLKGEFWCMVGGFYVQWGDSPTDYKLKNTLCYHCSMNEARIKSGAIFGEQHFLPLREAQKRECHTALFNSVSKWHTIRQWKVAVICSFTSKHSCTVRDLPSCPKTQIQTTCG